MLRALPSGDALSGKSENRKTLVNQLCLLATKPKKSKSLKLMQSVKKSESIYEAFGHYSATNSSGFSRYTELQYDVKGKLIGVKTLDYMLEKRRVASTTGPNFNIFYMLIKGATPDERSFWKLTDEFSYINAVDFPKVFSFPTVRMTRWLLKCRNFETT